MSKLGLYKIFEYAQERLTRGVRSINTDHAYIHENIAYRAYIELSAALGATPVEFSFKTPVNRYPHFKGVQLSGLGGTVKCSIRRGTMANPLVIDSAGVASAEITGPHNMRDGDGVSGVTILKTPTYIGGDNGELWQFEKVLGDATNQYTSANSIKMSENEEFMMKSDTYYVLRFERVGTDDVMQVTAKLFWYEEEGF